MVESVVITVMACNGGGCTCTREDEVKENKGLHILQLHNWIGFACGVKRLQPWDFGMMSCWWGATNVGIFVKI
jgi:hypothetical protein